MMFMMQYSTTVRAVLMATLLLAPARSLGVDPGTAYPSASEASDNRAGSVLVFPFFTTSATAPLIATHGSRSTRERPGGEARSATCAVPPQR